jgi:hypothetical protein
MQGPVEASVGASSILDTRSPRLHDPSAKIEVPSQQVRGELRLRLRRNGQAAFIYEQAIAGSYRALDPTQAAVVKGTARSTGVAVRYSAHLDEHFTIGLGLEALLWSIPYVEDMQCFRDCKRAVGTFAFSVVPAYRVGRWTFYGGLYAAPHPIARLDEPGVERGDYNLILHTGIELSVRQLSVLAQIQRDMTVAPASYGPSFGLAIAGRLPNSFPMH